jgi:hypothetical protein
LVGCQFPKPPVVDKFSDRAVDKANTEQQWPDRDVFAYFAQGSISKSGEGVKQKKRHTSPAAADRPLKKARIALRIAKVRCIAS